MILVSSETSCACWLRVVVSLPLCQRRLLLLTCLAMNPDGVFLSNGPGDPEPCDYAIAAIREFLDQRLPTFGICLGHQLMALAAGR
jgi:carbamoylphosphate synthase small subunit